MAHDSAIVYLLRSTQSDVTDVIRSLNSMHSFFLRDYAYPVILLVESNFTESFQRQIIESIPFSVIFENVQFPSYEEMNDPAIPRVLETHQGRQLWPLGYRHMCRFWTGDFLNHPALQCYNYIWRMDSDASLTKPVKYDLFRYMDASRISYGFSNTCEDEAEVCTGLHEFCRSYFEQKGVTFHWDRYRMYTTHVEWIHAPTFRNSEYTDLYEKIDQTKRFYLDRWGDAPIRYIAATNFGFRAEHLQIGYVHGNDGSGRREQMQQTK